MENLSDSSNDISIEDEEVQHVNDETDWKLKPENEKNFRNKVVPPYLVYPPTFFQNVKKAH